MILNKIKRKLNSPYFKETVEVLDTLITKYTKLLNKSHWLVVEAKQKFVSLLRDRGNIKPELLMKKLNYCEEIIAIIRVFEPNISRLNGIALYENYKTLHELSQNRFEAGEMLEDDFMVQISFENNCRTWKIN